MKLKSLLFAVCFSLIGQVFADNVHLNPNAKATDQNKKSVSKAAMYPGCEIQIINDSYNDVYVYGVFDDYAQVNFPIYAREFPHYIDLFYNGWCHAGMNIRIDSLQFPYQTIYSYWTSVNSTIRIIPYLKNGIKAEIAAK